MSRLLALALVLLAGCGPSAEELRAARAMLAEGERLNAQFRERLAAVDLVAAAAAFADLHALTRTKDLVAVEVPVEEGRTALRMVEDWRDDCRTEALRSQHRLVNLYLASQLPLAAIDAFYGQLGHDGWAACRAEAQAAARRQAATELRLVFRGDRLRDAVRQAVLSALRERVVAGLNLGYDLEPPPSAIGLVTVEVAQQSWRFAAADGTPLGLVPGSATLTVSIAPTAPWTASWEEPRRLTLTAAPSVDAAATREALESARASADAAFIRGVQEAVAVWPELHLTAPDAAVSP